MSLDVDAYLDAYAYLDVDGYLDVDAYLDVDPYLDVDTYLDVDVDFRYNTRYTNNIVLGNLPEVKNNRDGRLKVGIYSK